MLVLRVADEQRKELVVPTVNRCSSPREEEEISKFFLSVDFIGHQEMLVVRVIDEH